jgi:hypothetical protein
MISPSIFYNNRYILFQTHHPAIYKWTIFVVIPSMAVAEMPVFHYSVYLEPVNVYDLEQLIPKR